MDSPWSHSPPGTRKSHTTAAWLASTLIYWGNGCWRSKPRRSKNGEGYVATRPTIHLEFARYLAKRGPLLLVDEYLTSKLHAVCGLEMSSKSKVNLKVTPKTIDKLKVACYCPAHRKARPPSGAALRSGFADIHVLHGLPKPFKASTTPHGSDAAGPSETVECLATAEVLLKGKERVVCVTRGLRQCTACKTPLLGRDANAGLNIALNGLAAAMGRVRTGFHRKAHREFRSVAQPLTAPANDVWRTRMGAVEGSHLLCPAGGVCR